MIGRAELGRPLAQWQLWAGRCEIALIICLEILSQKWGAIFSGADILHPPNKCIYRYVHTYIYMHMYTRIYTHTYPICKISIRALKAGLLRAHNGQLEGSKEKLIVGAVIILYALTPDIHRI